MQKEIGGYIEFEHYTGRQFHEDAIKLNCARNCLAYLIKACNIKKLFIPYFLCDSVWKICNKYGVDFQFYNIDENFYPVISEKMNSDSWIYVVNYYGQLTNDIIKELKYQINNIIIDNVQAFFQKPVEDVLTIYTCRKFFGVADGAYLYTSNFLSDSFEIDCSYKRMNFLLGRFEKCASLFYQEYVANNDLFDNEPIKIMSNLTENLMKSFDYKAIAEKRTENFKYLHERLYKINQLKLQIPYGAFAYPLLLDNGFYFRKVLQEKKVYIPLLWPGISQFCEEKSIEVYYANNILPLPIDQRYGVDEMNYLVSFFSKEFS